MFTFRDEEGVIDGAVRVSKVAIRAEDDVFKQTCTRDIVVMIPGNPGSSSFYTEFLTHLLGLTEHRAVCIGLAGHSGANEGTFSVHDQITFVSSIVTRILDVNQEARVHIVGHSVGAFIGMHVAAGMVEDKVATYKGLFPTVEHIVKGSNAIMRPLFLPGMFRIHPTKGALAKREIVSLYTQQSLKQSLAYLLQFQHQTKMPFSAKKNIQAKAIQRESTIFFYPLFFINPKPGIRHVVAGFAGLLGYLPLAVRQRAARLFATTDCPHQLHTIANMADYSIISNVLYMAGTEMIHIKEACPDALGTLADKATFYYAVKDGWVADHLVGDMHAKLENITEGTVSTTAEGASPRVLRDTTGAPHAFVLSHSKEVAEALAPLLV